MKTIYEFNQSLIRFEIVKELRIVILFGFPDVIPGLFIINACCSHKTFKAVTKALSVLFSSQVQANAIECLLVCPQISLKGIN